MSSSATSLLQTALQNLHVAQQQQSQTPRPPSSRGEYGDGSDTYSDDDEDEELVRVGKGTAPGTPFVGQKGLSLSRGGSGSGRVRGKEREKDPLRTLPTHIAVRVFLQLDIRSLARCDRVCKRWKKSSTLNYIWFLQNRALILPNLTRNPQTTTEGKTRALDSENTFFDPYDKTPRLSSLPSPRLPTSQTPQWTKAESKKQWKQAFHLTLKRSDPNAEPEYDPMRVDIESLHSSGASTPGGRHGYAGLGSGGAAKWSGSGEGMSETERKMAAREGYKALGGRKSRVKRKMGGELGGKDKGGAVDDGRFDAPW